MNIRMLLTRKLEATLTECRSDNIHWIIGQVTQDCGSQWFPSLSIILCWVKRRAFIKWRRQFRLVISCLLGVMHRLNAVALIYACLCSASGSVISQETVWPLPHYLTSRPTSLVVDPNDFYFKVRFYHLFFRSFISYGRSKQIMPGHYQIKVSSKCLI